MDGGMEKIKMEKIAHSKLRQKMEKKTLMRWSEPRKNRYHIKYFICRFVVTQPSWDLGLG